MIQTAMLQCTVGRFPNGDNCLSFATFEPEVRGLMVVRAQAYFITLCP